MAQSIPRSFRVLIILVAILAPIAVAYWWIALRTPPLESLSILKLGMTETEVSLAYGSKPTCPSEDTADHKTMTYTASCGVSASLLRQPDGQFVVYRICSTLFWPDGFGPLFNEEKVISKIGKPSFVSVHKSATRKFSSFPDYNLAIEFRASRAEEWCVVNPAYLPIKYNDALSP